MRKTSTPAQIRKGQSEIAKLITDRRLAAAIGSIAGDAKLFAKAKANPKALLAKHGMKVPSIFAIRLRLSRELTKPGRKFTICFHYRYEVGSGGVFYDENGDAYPVKGVIEGDVCTTFRLPK